MPTAAEVNDKGIILACIKAFAKLMRSKVLRNSIFTSALISKILKHYGCPHRVVVGYMQMEPLHISYPQMWIETGAGDVTDITWSAEDRMIVVLGQGFGFAEGARKPTYARTPQFDVYPVALGIPVLQEMALDLEGYLSRASRDLQVLVEDTFKVAINGDDKIEVLVDASLLPNANANATASPPGQ